MNRAEVLQGVIEGIEEVIGDEFSIDERTLLRQDLSVDSLDTVEITMEIEENLDITIPDDLPWMNPEKDITVGELADHLLVLVNEQTQTRTA